MSVRDGAEGFGRDGGLTFEQRAALVRLDPDMTPRHVIEENLPARTSRWRLFLIAAALCAWALGLAVLAIDVIGARP